MTPNPIDMLVFLEVVETQSFTAAAARLGRTTSAVSQAVTRLEGALGTRLFYRTTRSLSLTEAGMRAAGQFRELKRIYSDAVADLTDNAAAATGRLSVTAPHALSYSVIGPALQNFLAGNPDLNCRLIADDAHVDMVEHQIDLAIRVGNSKHQGARITKIGTLSEAIYCSGALLTEMGGPPATFRDLETWDHIANDWQGTPVSYKRPDGTSLKAVPRFRCNSFPDVLQFTVAGAGIALLPDHAAKPYEDDKRLVKLFSISQSPVFAIHMFEGKAPRVVRDFITLLKSAFRTAP